MAGVIWGSTDLQTSYGFVIERNGLIANPPEPIHHSTRVPGRDGAVFQGTDLAEPLFSIRGIINGTSNDDLQTKLKGLVNELSGAWAAHPNAGSGYTAPTRAVKTLTIPKFGPSTDLRKFPNCSYNGMTVDKFVQPRYLTIGVQVTIKFIQWNPEATAA